MKASSWASIYDHMSIYIFLVLSKYKETYQYVDLSLSSTWDEDIEDYMVREVLPYIPDAKWFWEEDLTKKKPVIKIGAEIPFTRYFYKYQQPVASEELAKQFAELEASVSAR